MIPGACKLLATRRQTPPAEVRMSPGVDFIDQHGDPAGIAPGSVPIQGPHIAGAKTSSCHISFSFFIFRGVCSGKTRGDFLREASGLYLRDVPCVPQAAVGWWCRQ